MTDIKNMQLWRAVEKTKTFDTKGYEMSRKKYTAIAPYSQILAATKQWGAYGNEWGLKEVNHTLEKFGEDVLAICAAVFYYPSGAFELSVSLKIFYQSNKGYQILVDDYRKKIETDLLTKALSKLGFNADVFLGKFDDNVYLSQLKDEEEAEKRKANKKTLTLELVPKVVDWLIGQNYKIEKAKEFYSMSDEVYKDLEIAYKAAKEPKTKPLPILEISDLEKVANGLIAKELDIAESKKHYTMTKEVATALKAKYDELKAIKAK